MQRCISRQANKGMNTHFSPEHVIQRQLDAYNAKDVEALVAIYAEDAQTFEHPSKLVASGISELRQRFKVRFQEPNLHAALLKRIVMGHIFIAHELVTRTFPEGAGTLKLTMIYEVQNGKISKAWMIPGSQKIDPKT